MSGFEYQWRTAAKSDDSLMDDGPGCQADTSNDAEMEDQPGSSEDYEMEDQPIVSEEDGSEYQPPSSSEGDESTEEVRRPQNPNNVIRIPQESVTLSQDHLSANTDLKVGTVISVGQTLQLHDGSSFLTVTQLGRYKYGGLIFFGYLYRRIEDFQNYLPIRSGGTELVWLCEAKEHDPKPGGYLRSARSKDVLRIRHLVHADSDSTSESFPQHGPIGMWTDDGPLICRWKLEAELSDSHATKGVRSFKSIKKGNQRQPTAFIELSGKEPVIRGTAATGSYHSQHQLDSDPPRANSDDRSDLPKTHGRATGRSSGTGNGQFTDPLAPNNNGNRISKAKRSAAVRESVDHLATRLERTLKISSAQRTVSEQGNEPQIYTYADGFCGAGGMAKGAKDAGLCIVWAFDQDENAIKTYSRNHGKDSCKQMSAQKFLESGNAYGTLPVDILHFSPPCQGLTPATRGHPKNQQEDNQCMTYVARIVEKVKPRIVTFEQVPEVLTKGKEYFQSMVRELTSNGYSARWRILECADFGVPQKRKRLFVTASRRGEVLPEFPKPTHSHYTYCDQLGLQRWNSFAGAINSLDKSAPNHVNDHPRKERRIEKCAPPISSDWPCHDTITTGAGWPDHYNGKYLCTPREGACVQGFPPDYVFCGNLPAIKRQVVNAVPPPIGKAILEECKMSLMRTDALRRF